MFQGSESIGPGIVLKIPMLLMVYVYISEWTGKYTIQKNSISDSISSFRVIITIIDNNDVFSHLLTLVFTDQTIMSILIKYLKRQE